MRRRWIILLLAGLSLALAPAARSAQPVQAYPANAAQAPDPAPEYVPGELILGLKDDVELKALSLPQGMRAAAVSSELARLQSALVRVPPGQEEAYRKKMVNQPGVLFVEPNYIVYPVDTTPNDPLYPDQWGLPAVGAPAAWNITTGSEAVIVAVIDSGIDPGHPEFAGRLLTGYDFVRNTDSLIDPCGHGTHVAGIIAASGNNGIGIAGVDWQARILPLRVLNDRCSGTVANIARALVYAVDHHGAQVINLSLGRTAPSRLLENATYYAYRRGAALIAAAGNSGCGLGGSPSSVVYPARYPWTLAVSAIDSSHLPAWFSSCGAEVDLAAPGVGILSTTPMQGNFFYQSPTVPNEYGSLSGTSMAAPHVSGAAALLAGRGFEHPDAIFKALNDSARDIDILGFDNKTGNGLLQIDAALGCQMTSPTGPSGGSYQCEPFCLELPAGMLDGDATLRISTFTHFAAAPAHYLPLGAYAEITLDPKPIPPLIPAPRVCYRYTAADLVKVGGRPENLHFAVYTPETQFWQRLATSVDRQAQRIYSDVPHFSIFGVFYTPMPETPPVTGAHFPAAPAGWLLAALGGAGAFWIWRSLRSRRA